MEKQHRPRVLCVDDEPNVLDGLFLHLRRRYEVVTAPNGMVGIEILERERAIGVVISDMRMPGMDGARFLSHARDLAPDATRILLTGQADLTSAIHAVNEGQIFRFLTKPCPPPALLAAVAAAAEQHRLITGERVLLEQTLHGSIQALTDVLSLTNPVAFGRAGRIKQHVTDLAAKLGMKERWQLEVAAMLSQLGSIILPPETAEKVYYGRPLSEAEQEMVSKAPEVTEQLVGRIPRLELVRAILAASAKPHKNKLPEGDSGRLVSLGAQVLRAALDFDALESQGSAASLAVDTMRSRAEHYGPEVIEALAEVYGVGSSGNEVRELPFAALRVGMVIAEDLKLTSGMLLATIGYEITPSFVERAKNFRPGVVKEPVRVIVRDGQ